MDDFVMTVVNNHLRPIVRQSEEGLLIGETVRRKEMGDRIVLMNNKTQFYQPGIVRASYGPVQ